MERPTRTQRHKSNSIPAEQITRRRILTGIIAAPFVATSAWSQSSQPAPQGFPAKSVINMHNAPAWQPVSRYAIGARVTHAGNAYQAVAVNTWNMPFGTADTATWKYLSPVDFSDIISLCGYFKRFASNSQPHAWTRPVTVQFWNDAEWVWTSPGPAGHIGINAHTGGQPLGASATCPLVITAAPGESFRDNPNVRSNPLNYDPTKGVAIRSSNWAGLEFINIWKDYVTVRGLQIKGAKFAISADGVWMNNIFEESILVGDVFFTAGDYVIRNCLINGTVTASYGIGCFNNTIIGSGSGSAFNPQYNPANGSRYIIENNLVYGFAQMFAAGGADPNLITASHNQTDLPTPRAGFTTVSSLDSQFVDRRKDFRLKMDAPAHGAAAPDPTNAARDISGLARPQKGKWDLGCWELAG